MRKIIMVAACLALGACANQTAKPKYVQVVETKTVYPRVFIDKEPWATFLGIGDMAPVHNAHFDFTKMETNLQDGELIEVIGVVSPDGKRILTKVKGLVKVRKGKIAYQMKEGRVFDTDGKEGMAAEELLTPEMQAKSPVVQKVVTQGRKFRVEMWDLPEKHVKF